MSKRKLGQLSSFAFLLIILIASQNCSQMTAANFGFFKARSKSYDSLSQGKLMITAPSAESDLALDWNTVFKHPDQWDATLSKTDVIQLWDYDLPSYDSETLDAIVNIANARHQLISVEMMPLDNGACSAGASVDEKVNAVAQYTATQVIAHFKLIFDRGGEITFAGADSAEIERVVDGSCGLTVPQAIRSQILFYQAVHAVYPNVQFGIVANFANYNYKGTSCYWNSNPRSADCAASFKGVSFDQVLERMVTDVRAAGEEIYFVHADNPYMYYHNHAGVTDVVQQRLLPLQIQTQSFGMRFGLVYNTELQQNAALSADSFKKFHDQTLQAITEFNQGGGNPDNVIIESWFNYPAYNLPEGKSGTFMNTAYDAISAFQNLSGTTNSVDHSGTSAVRLPASAGTLAPAPSSASMAPADPGRAQPDLSMQTIYRLYNPTDGDHLYSTSMSEGLPAYNLEGPAFQLFNSPSNGRGPLYRCVDNSTGYHFLSIDAACESQTFEGLIGYIGNSATASAPSQIYRCLQSSSGLYLVTINQGECVGASYAVEGLLGYGG